VSEAQQTAETPSSFSVLLVDDDLDVLGANSRFLRVNGYSVIVANSAATGLERLQQQAVHAVVTDLRMPGMDGIEFVRQLRLLQPLTPVLFFSAYAEVPDVVEAMKLGAVDFLQKPVDPELLLKRLTEIQQPGIDALVLQREAFNFTDVDIPYRQRVLAYEKYLIETFLLKYGGKVALVLEALKINRRTLNEKMSRLGINRKDLT